MGKGEIARYEQFLLFPQCFQKACFPGASKGVVVWECVKFDEKSSPKEWKTLNAGNTHFLTALLCTTFLDLYNVIRIVIVSLSKDKNRLKTS